MKQKQLDLVKAMEKPFVQIDIIYPFDFIEKIIKEGKYDYKKLFKEGMVLAVDIVDNIDINIQAKLTDTLKFVDYGVDIIVFDFEEFEEEFNKHIKFIHESRTVPDPDFFLWLFRILVNLPNKSEEDRCVSAITFEHSNQKLEEIGKGQWSYYISTRKDLLCDSYVKTLQKIHHGKIRNFNNNKKPKTKRTPINNPLRHETFKRDNYTCVECNRNKDKDNVVLHCDHILPVSQGGTDELSNLQTLCEDCNLAKFNRKW